MFAASTEYCGQRVTNRRDVQWIDAFSILDASAKQLRKVHLTLRMSVCLSVRAHRTVWLPPHSSDEFS